MVDNNTEVLQRYAQRNFGLDLNGALRLITGINKDVNGITQQLYGRDFNGAYVQVKGLLGGNSLILPGTNGSYLQTTDKASLRFTSDFDFRVELEEVGVTGGNRDIVSRYTPTTNQSYEWRLNGFGFDEIVWSTLGTDALTDTEAIYPGGQVAIRFTMDADNGSSQRVLSWYRSDNNLLTGNWVLRNQKVVAGATSVFAGTTVLRIGARGDAPGANPFSGRMRRMELRNEAGTVVLNPDFRFLAAGTPAYTDPAGNVYTYSGGAVIG